jgi:hypothetical protein
MANFATVQGVQLSSDESLTSPRNTVAKFATAMKPLLISDEIVTKNIKKQKKVLFWIWLLAIAIPSLTSDGVTTEC